MSQGTVYAAPRRPDMVPANYTELFSTYYDYVVGLVVTSGIDTQNAEDVAMAILTTFFEKDVLADFNPEYTSEYGGVVRKAVFRTFLSGFVKIYVRHYRDRQNVSKVREPAILDSETVNVGETRLIDVISPRHDDDDHADLQYESFVRSVSLQLLANSKPSSSAKCTMAQFFSAVADQVYKTGYLSVPELAKSLGMCETAAYNWMARLRAELPKVAL